MIRNKKFSTAFLVLVFALLGSSDSFGQLFFNGGGDNNWNTAANWTSGTVPGIGSSPLIIPLLPQFPNGFNVNVGGTPPETGDTLVNFSTLNVTGTFRPTGISTPALSVVQDSVLSVSGLVETSGSIFIDDSTVFMDGGTIRTKGSGANSEITMNNCAVSRNSTSALETPVLILDNVELDLFAGDQIDDLIELTFIGVIDVKGEQNMPNGTINAVESSEVQLNANLTVDEISIGNGSTIRLNTGLLTSNLLSFDRSVSGLPIQIFQDGGNFNTNDLSVEGTGVSIVVSKNDVVSNLISVSQNAVVEIEGPVALPAINVESSGRVEYVQPAGSLVGLDLQQFSSSGGLVDLTLNDVLTDGVVWGLRVPGEQIAAAQNWINMGTFAPSNLPVDAIYDAAAFGDFTYIGYVREITTSLSGGILTLDGTDFNDIINVSIDPQTSDVLVKSNGGSTPEAFSGVTSVVVNGAAGQDVITVDNVVAEVFGGPGNDDITITGSQGATIFGGAGDDMITGGDGDDNIEGGLGADVILGGAGDDIIAVGGTGLVDTSINNINGGQGDDMIMGDAGDDIINGANGADRIYGFGGADDLLGGGGSDFIEGGDGDDFVSGGIGDDMLFGDDGIDTLQGGGGDDEMFGGDGDDIMNGFDGRDRMEGGDGNDDVRGGKQRDIIIGGNGDDFVSGQGGNDVVRGGNGNDDVGGGAGRDNLFGDAGTDILIGNGGADFFNGGAGDDAFFGGSGCDTALDRAELGASSVEK